LSIADKNSLARWEALSLGYTESNGLPALREEVAGMYESVSPDEVIVGAPEELIYLSMRAMLKPGDTVVVSYPGYQSLCVHDTPASLPLSPRPNSILLSNIDIVKSELHRKLNSTGQFSIRRHQQVILSNSYLFLLDS
jgi:hypothetical protein